MIHCAIIGMLLISTALGAAEPRALRVCWMPLSDSDEQLSEVLTLASRYGVTAFQLSHKIAQRGPLDLTDNPARARRLLPWIGQAATSGHQIWLWTHEIDNLPALPSGLVTAEPKPKLVCTIDDPSLAEALMVRYATAYAASPQLTGMVATFAESTVPVYQAGGGEAVHHIASVLWQATEAAGRKLVVRDFAHTPADVAKVVAGLAGLPLAVPVMSKIYPHDWNPYYPINPNIGRFAGREQWVEFDLGFEYEGQNMLPYADPHRWFDQVAYCRAAGVTTLCLRLDRCQAALGHSATATPWGRLNLACFSAAAADQRATAEAAIARWEREDPSGFPGAGRWLEDSTRAVRLMMFPRGLWYQNHSAPPLFHYADGHISGDKAPSAWSGSAAQRALEDRAERPDREFLLAIAAEDEEVARLLDRMRAELAKVPPDRRAPWQEGLAALELYAELFRLSKYAFWEIKLHRVQPSDGSRDRAKGAVDAYAAAIMRRHPLPAKSAFFQWADLRPTIETFRKQLD